MQQLSAIVTTKKSKFNCLDVQNEINGEKMQKLSAIVTTISDKQYHND